MIAILKTLWASFRVLPTLAQILGPLLVVGSLWGAYALWRNSIYNEGWQAAINAIAAQDQEAVNAAEEAANRMRACRTTGGVWRTSTGICQRR